MYARENDSKGIGNLGQTQHAVLGGHVRRLVDYTNMSGAHNHNAMV